MTMQAANEGAHSVDAKGPHRSVVIGSGAIFAALCHFAGFFIIGWLLGGSNPRERAVLGITTTARNSGAALVPAASSFNDPNVTILIIVGAIVCLIVAFAPA